MTLPRVALVVSLAVCFFSCGPAGDVDAGTGGGSASAGGGASTGGGSTGGSAGTGGGVSGTGGSGGSGGGSAGGSAGGAAGGTAGGSTGDAGVPLAVAVGYGQRRMHSFDGLTWVLKEKTANGGDDNDLFRGVTYGNGRFVAVGGSSVALTQVSDDGINWVDGGTSRAWLGGVAWTGSAFVAAGGNGLRVRSTDNAQSWTNDPGYQAYHYRSVAFGAGQVVAVGHTYNGGAPDGGNVGLIVSTPDGITWTERRRAGEAQFGDVAFGNGIFVASSSNRPVVATSSDGMTWADQTVGTGTGGVIFTGTEFVLARGSGLYTSMNGTTWTMASPNSRGVAGFIAGRYIAWGWPLRVSSSTNLMTWTPGFEPLGSGMTQMVTGKAK